MKYSNKQHNLNKTMRNTYNENMDFLKTIDPVLYNRIYQLNEQINNNNYQINYDIELKDNSLNIYDINKKVFLYDKNLDEYSNEALQTINYDLENVFLDLPLNFYNISNIYNIKLQDIGITESSNSHSDIFISSLMDVYTDIYKFRKTM